MAAVSRLSLRLILLVSVLLACPCAAGSFVVFESGQVRPLALSPAGTKLFAVNTPDNRLEVFDVGAAGLTHSASVPVGLEPVAVAARSEDEVWVVNHLSDSVSVVDVSTSPPQVVRTLLVGDEPRDLVFAGPGGSLAFITTAHRGQNSAVPLADLTTPGIGRADVWVFDASDPGAALGGAPRTVITLFGDTPRALAASPDGSTVYAAVFHSGNQTTSLSEGVVCNGGPAAGSCTILGVAYPGGLPPPIQGADGVVGPETGLIVKFEPASGHWEDRLGRNWDDAVRFFLPDDDVFQIDASVNPPVPRISSPHAGQPFAHVGTILFNMLVNPASGRVYVTNTESHNEVRFEGQRPPCAPLTPGGPVPNSVVGRLSEARITVLDPSSGAVTPHHLNSHIDYCTVPSPPGTADRSLASPLGMAITADGRTLYVAALGSSDPALPGSGKVGVFDTAALESDTFTPGAANQIVLSGGGASGLVLDEARHRLYVLTRFDDAVSVVDTTASPGTEIQHLPFFNPEPASVVAGRPFLYDATRTSSNGEASCASCHIFSDFDSLAWDLGDPDGTVMNDPNPFRVPDFFNIAFNGFHPLKGPMTTQTLRGMVNDGPMHWRGDRTAGNDPGGNPLDSHGAFEKFNVAFVGLTGMPGHCSATLSRACDDLTPCPAGESCVGLAAADMDAFTDFILQVTPPPNPIRAIDGSLTPDQQAGRNLFFSISDEAEPCNGCHALDPANGHFGTDGFSSFENEPQNAKIPHLRNAYAKVGMFGMPAIGFLNPGNNGIPGPPATQPDQIRGFGFLHDGSVDTLFRFHNAAVFDQAGPFGSNPSGFPNGAAGDPQRRQVEQFVLAFDSDMAPAVGQQITLTDSNAAVVGPRIDLLVARAMAGDCDLVVKGNQNGRSRGWLLGTDDGFVTDFAGEPEATDGALRAQAAAGEPRTYTCVPPGSGERIGIDRDGDGAPDATEVDEGTDPTDPASRPPSAPYVPVVTRTLRLVDASGPPPRPSRRRVSFKAASRRLDPIASRIVPPARGGSGDPTLGGAVVTVYNAAGLTDDDVRIVLPASGWRASGGATPTYRFHGADPDAPISSVQVHPDGLVVKGGRSGWTYTLDEPSQGEVAIRVQLGTGTRWCGVAAAKGTKASNDGVDRFVGVGAAPAFCPPQP
jgi:YVTN family beta-propeller protein